MPPDLLGRPSQRGILVVDDESLVRQLIRQILSSAGYQTIIEAVDGVDAYQLIKQTNLDIALVITDIRMPKMNGAELSERLREEYPHIDVLCISGYADPISPNGHYFLAKPFTPKALLALVKDVFELPSSHDRT